jgi:hypothetical protein
MDADSILSRSSQVEKIDTGARRTFELASPASGNGTLNLNVLTGGRAIVQVNQKNEQASVQIRRRLPSGLSRRLWLAP